MTRLSKIFTRCSNDILQPRILEYTNEIIKGSPFRTCDSFYGKHTESLWEFLDMSNSVTLSYKTDRYLEELPLKEVAHLLQNDTEYLVQVSYYSRDIKSSPSDPVRIQVLNLNSNPIFLSITGSFLDASILHNTVYNLQVEISDPENDPFVLEWDIISEYREYVGVSLTQESPNNYRLTIDLSSLPYTSESFSLEIMLKTKDNQHETYNTYSISKEVVVQSQPPIILGIELTPDDKILKNNTDYTCTVHALDPENTSLKYAFSISDSNKVTSFNWQENSNQVVFHTANSSNAGQFTITCQVTNEFNKLVSSTVSYTLNGSCTIHNSEIEWYPEDTSNLEANTEYYILIYPSDQDNICSYSANVTCNKSSVELTQVEPLKWRVYPTRAESQVIFTITVSDGYGSICTTSVTKGVIEVLKVVSVTISPSVVSNRLDSDTTYDISCCANSPQGEPTWSITVENDSNNAVVSTEGPFSYTGCENSNLYGARFSVTTSGDIGESSVDIIVTASVGSDSAIGVLEYDVNYPPEVSSVTYYPNHSFLVSGFTYSFNIHASDPENDTLYYTVEKNMIHGEDSGTFTHDSSTSNQFTYIPQISNTSLGLPYNMHIKAYAMDSYNGSKFLSRSYNETKMYIEDIKIKYQDSDTEDCIEETGNLDPAKEYYIEVYVRDDNNFDFSDFSYSGSLTNCSDSDVAVLSHEDTLCGQAQEYSFPYKIYRFKLNSGTNADNNQCDFTFNITLSNEGGSVSDQKTITLIYGASYSPPSFTVSVPSNILHINPYYEINIDIQDTGGADIADILIDMNVDSIYYVHEITANSQYKINVFELSSAAITNLPPARITITVVNSAGFRSVKRVLGPQYEYHDYQSFAMVLDQSVTGLFWYTIPNLLILKDGDGNYVYSQASTVYAVKDSSTSNYYTAFHTKNFNLVPTSSIQKFELQNDPPRKVIDNHGLFLANPVKNLADSYPTYGFFVGYRSDTQQGSIVKVECPSDGSTTITLYGIDNTSIFKGGAYSTDLGYMCVAGYSSSEGIIYIHNLNNPDSSFKLTFSDIFMVDCIVVEYQSKIYVLFVGVNNSDSRAVFGSYNITDGNLVKITKIQGSNVFKTNMYIHYNKIEQTVEFVFRGMADHTGITEDNSTGAQDSEISKYTIVNYVKSSISSFLNGNYGLCYGLTTYTMDSLITGLVSSSYGNTFISIWEYSTVQYGGVRSYIIIIANNHPSIQWVTGRNILMRIQHSPETWPNCIDTWGATDTSAYTSVVTPVPYVPRLQRYKADLTGYQFTYHPIGTIYTNQFIHSGYDKETQLVIIPNNGYVLDLNVTPSVSTGNLLTSGTVISDSNFSHLSNWGQARMV